MSTSHKPYVSIPNTKHVSLLPKLIKYISLIEDKYFNSLKIYRKISNQKLVENNRLYENRTRFSSSARFAIWLIRIGDSDTGKCITCCRILYRSLSWGK